MERKCLEAYYPLLIVRDFGKKFKISNEFMTNADVVSLITKGVVNNPINPFTSKKLDGSEKMNSVQYILASHNNTFSIDGVNTFVPGKWYSVHFDIWNVAKEDVVLPY